MMSPTVAIVGISTALPSGSYSSDNLGHDAFFEFLMARGQSYEPLPSHRFDVQGWQGNGLGTIRVDRGSFLKNIDMFDNVEFGVSHRDAKAMSPATRMLLEQCFLALLDSGIDYRTKNIGCYTSGTSIDLTNVTESDEYDARGSFAHQPSMIANRISVHLDLLGPSIPVDTACSSTITAFHLALQAIRDGECDAAVVAGCQLNHRLIDWISYSQMSVLAEDGMCKPFDASADGFSRAEGCVSVVLKPLEQATEDGDHIYGIVLGSGVNSSGAGAPPGAPVAESQRAAMLHAFNRSGRNPKDVDYVELHATGTARGDPTEANWAGESFGRDDELIVGSVKGNIGHTEITSFLASLSKILSVIEHGVIPPNANLHTPNPAIQWDKYKLHVPIKSMPLSLRNGDRPLIAISSSGIGGSNGHVVIEGPRTPGHFDQATHFDRKSILLMASGLTPRTSTSISQNLMDYLKSSPQNVLALSTIQGRRAKQMTWRSYAVFDRGSPLSDIRFSTPQHCPRAIKLAMIFSGQGPQHVHMGRELFDKFPVFRASVLEMDETYQAATGKSIIHDMGLFHGDSIPQFPETWPISVILPSLTIFQIALYDLLLSLGVKPDALIGHSAGETAVLYASGAAPKALAVELAVIRGSVFSSIEGLGGSMAALSCSAEIASTIIADALSSDPAQVVEIACYNSQNAVAIAGHASAIQEVLRTAQNRGILGRSVRTHVPIHSSLMDACQEEFRSRVEALFERYPGSHLPKVPTYSTLTGKRVNHAYDADYFWNNTRSQVRFVEAMENMASDFPVATFVEIAPHPVLASYVSSMIGESSDVLSIVKRPKFGELPHDERNFIHFCGKLTSAGHNCINFAVLNGPAPRIRSSELPTYPFLRKQFPLYPDTPSYAKQANTRLGPLNHDYLRINKETHPTLGEHVIRGEPIMPAAGFLEMALEFGATALMNVNIRSMLSLSAEVPTKVNVKLDGSFWTVKSIQQRPSSGSHSSMHRLHADGYLSFEPTTTIPDLNIPAIRSRCPSYTSSAFYTSLSYFSSYGPRLQRVANIYYNASEALVSIRGLDRILTKEGQYVLHPAVLDACIHATAFRPFSGVLDPDVFYLPARVGAVILHQRPQARYFPSHVFAHVEHKHWAPNSLTYDITLTDELGHSLCSLKSLEVEKHRLSPPPQTTRAFDVILQSPNNHELGLNAMNPHIISGTGDFKVSEEFDHDSDLCRDAVACVLSSLGTRKKFIRICVANQTDINLDFIIHACNKNVEVFCELILCRAFSTALSLKNGIVRNIDLDVVRANGGFLLFDVVISVDTSTADISCFLRRCADVLLPGGMFINIERNQHLSDVMLPPRLPHKGMHGLLPSVLPGAPKPVANSWRNAGLSDPRIYPSTSDTPPYVVMLSQKSQQTLPKPSEALFEEEEAFVYEYVPGDEMRIQWEFAGLQSSQELDIWILATEGTDAGAAVGFTRALRKEFPFWTIRLVVFPQSSTEYDRMAFLSTLPLYMRNELELVVSTDGFPLVPKMVPIPQIEWSPVNNSSTANLPIPHGHLSLQTLASYRISSAGLSGILGSVVNGNGTGIDRGLTVVTLTQGTCEGLLILDSAIVSPVPGDMIDVIQSTPSLIPACAIASLAPGLNIFNVPSRFKRLRVLLTHSETEIGAFIKWIYSSRNYEFIEVTSHISLLDLSSRGLGDFHLIISGYDDRAFIQVLESLLHPTHGKLFSWNGPNTSLEAQLSHDPWSISDALRETLLAIQGYTFPAHPLKGEETPAPSHEAIASPLPVCFNPKKLYLILGGVGSIGAHIALYMYQHGARNVLVTSRSGEVGLASRGNALPRKIFSYLKGQADLNISLEAADATSLEAMQSLIRPTRPEIGGCVILTGIIANSLFMHLNQEEFSSVLHSKTGVLPVLDSVVHLADLEFIVAFSSVGGLFGNGGQSHYAASNTALEHQMNTLSNGFTFVCPGILDSASMLGSGQDAKERLRQVIDWSISAEDMICWLDDAFSRYQRGVRFHRYVPDLDWEAMNRTLGMSIIGKHLLPETSEAVQQLPDDNDRISEIVRAVLNIPVDTFSSEVPLTSYGIDSLSATKLAFSLRSTVHVTQLQLLSDISVNDIRRKAREVSCHNDATGVPNESAKRATSHTVVELLDRYTDELLREYTVSSDVSRTFESFTPTSVLLTGSTGAFGCSILAQLLRDEKITRVYAFNRAHAGSSLKERQISALRAQGYPVSLVDNPKLTLIEGDLTKRDLGISKEVRETLLLSVTHIIHCAWKIHFSAPLIDYEPLIEGIMALLDFVGKSRASAKFMFISTVGVYYRPNTSIAPEAPILDPKVVISAGYPESKWIAERLLQIAAEKLAFKTSIVRVGLLTGSPSGCWDPSQWFPSLIQSAEYIGCLPDGDESISWIQPEVAAAAVVDMLDISNETLHVVHPHPVRWSTVIKPIAQQLGVPLVPYDEWFSRLESSANDYESQSSSPSKARNGLRGELSALRLVDFYRLGSSESTERSHLGTESMGLIVKVATQKGISASPSLTPELCPQINLLDIEKWMEYWRMAKFLTSSTTT